MVLLLLVAVAAVLFATRAPADTSNPIPPDQGPPLPSPSPSSTFDEAVVTNTGNVSQGVIDFAHAIARAEGFGVPGAIPTRANNPGDLVLSGRPTLGAERISVFPSADDGWQALYHQLMLIVLGQSHVYTIDMTFGEMASKWTATQPDAWAANVIGYLLDHGYDWIVSDSTIGEVLLS